MKKNRIFIIVITIISLIGVMYFNDFGVDYAVCSFAFICGSGLISLGISSIEIKK